MLSPSARMMRNKFSNSNSPNKGISNFYVQMIVFYLYNVYDVYCVNYLSLAPSQNTQFH